MRCGFRKNQDAENKSFARPRSLLFTFLFIMNSVKRFYRNHIRSVELGLEVVILTSVRVLVSKGLDGRWYGLLPLVGDLEYGSTEPTAKWLATQAILQRVSADSILLLPPPFSMQYRCIELTASFCRLSLTV